MADKVAIEEALEVWLRLQLAETGIDTYSGMATKDAPFPYIVYKMDFDMVDDVIMTGQLIIDLWDYNQKRRDIMRLAEQVIALVGNKRLEQSEIETIFDEYIDYDGDNIFSAARITLSSNRHIDTDTDNVNRQELRFNLRLDRKKQLVDLFGRQNIWKI